MRALGCADGSPGPWGYSPPGSRAHQAPLKRMSLTWRARPAGDAFRNGNVVHLFVIYSLTLNGNPMGPIKAPSVPSAQPREGWSPSSSRGKKYSKWNRLLSSHLRPPHHSPRLPRLLKESSLLPRSASGHSPFHAGGRRQRTPL